jgi:hypothetical protein
MIDRPAMYHELANARRARCSCCGAIPKVSYTTPIIEIDPRTNIGVEVASVVTCSNHYCRARAGLDRLSSAWDVPPSASNRQPGEQP